jgi:hypothetical protein
LIVGSHSEFPMTVRSESRQEERKDGGQISGVRSERRVRPSLDQEEPARSLKCKIEAVVQLHFRVLAIGVSDTEKLECRNTLQQECPKSRYVKIAVI